MEALENLRSSLKLTDDKALVTDLPMEAIQRGKNLFKLSLVGKILSHKRINREDFINQMKQVWDFVGTVIIQSLGENIFLFKFNTIEDREAILTNEPLHFDHQILFFINQMKLQILTQKVLISSGLIFGCRFTMFP